MGREPGPVHSNERMKKYSLTFFFFCVLVATIFFDDPHLYYYKRIVYIFFLVLSSWELYLFYYKRKTTTEDGAMPRFYRVYRQIFAVFILYNLIVDFRSPTFSVVTLLNHPLAVLAVVPVLAFPLGYQASKTEIDKFIRFLLFTGILFCLLFVFPIQGKNIYAQGVACCYAVLPLSLFALERKKYRLFALLLIVLSVFFSQVSESRTIVLRMLLFFGLLLAMTAVKKWSPLKLVVIVITGFFVYQFLTNLEAWLELFKSFIHVKNFDDEDTRTFLYEEVFGDMKGSDLLLGRGFLGTYFSPYFLWLQTNNRDFTGDYYYRFSVEVGFLQFLLKGGFVYFILYITPLVAACYKGLFTPHGSRIAFYISVYVLCELMIMFIENIPAWHFQFFIIFFLAGYGYRQAVLETKTKTATNEDLYHNPLLQPGTVY
jgi:hypothetical protein